jgi:hypothetical protein
VVLHLDAGSEWPAARQALAELGEPFDLFVSLRDGLESTSEAIREVCPGAFVYEFPAPSGDALGFLSYAHTGVLNRYTLVLKLSGDIGAASLTGTIARRVRLAFASDPDLGIVIATGRGVSDRLADEALGGALQEFAGSIGLDGMDDSVPQLAGRSFWLRPFLLHTLCAAMRPTTLSLHPSVAAAALNRLLGLVCRDADQRITEVGALKGAIEPAASQPRITVVAYYLPQFYPTEENNKWWGAGFTEWTNTTRARPLFKGHRQPRLPADLGFCDLRLPETREAQAALARQYGIGAFCYYYYWFDGPTMLRRPLEEVLATGRPDFPFMLCWANEPWGRNWDGGNQAVLIPQLYAAGWVSRFATEVAPLLHDPRYFRLAGRPVLLIYRLMQIPEPAVTVVALREALRGLGIPEMHLCAVLSVPWSGKDLPDDPATLGLDGYVEFPPHRVRNENISDTLQGLAPNFSGRVNLYDTVIEGSLTASPPVDGGRWHRGVMMGWDNTARVGLRGHIYHGATPAKLRRWLRGLVRQEVVRPGPAERLLFINAWNEWAEGTYLEPDQEFGTAWLEAVRSALGEAPRT